MAAPVKRELLAPRSPYSDRQVARAKALLLVCTAKGVARLTGAPLTAVCEWRRGQRRKEVKPDLDFLRNFERWAREP